jgi:hypothetical protein
MLSRPGLGDLLDLPPLAQRRTSAGGGLYFGYSELNPVSVEVAITSRTRSSLVKATVTIAARPSPELTSAPAARSPPTPCPGARSAPAAALIVVDLTHPQPFCHRPSLRDQHRSGNCPAERARPGKGHLLRH